MPVNEADRQDRSLLLAETPSARARGYDLGGTRRGHKITDMAGEPHLNVADLAAPGQHDALESQPAASHRTVVGDVQVRRGESLLVAEGGGHRVAGGRVGEGRQVAAEQCPVGVADLRVEIPVPPNPARLLAGEVGQGQSPQGRVLE